MNYYAKEERLYFVYKEILMKTLKKLISGYMYRVTFVVVAVILVLLLYIQVSTEQRRAYEDADRTFMRIEAVLEENQQELAEIQEEYKQTCLHNAETVARIIEGDPDVLDDVEELKKIAESVEIDEIHIFDNTGRIFTGTHPQYFELTFDSGEQMMFFKPMLEDKSLKLVQDITPNTAEEKPMQYSAVWSYNGEFIVQVGMEPVNVLKETKKNELSYIFSMFRVDPDVDFYAIDAESGEIVGSTNLETVGLNSSEIGIDLSSIQNDEDGFHMLVNGQHSFCVFKKIGANYIGRAIPSSTLYQRVPTTAIWIFISLLIVAFFLAKAVVRYMDRYVVMKINDVNEKLKSIADGNLEENVDIQSSVEFAELSNYVNSMVKSLLDNNKKMSYVLSKTNMHIGTYEYGIHTKKVRYTEEIPKILSVDNDRMEQLASDSNKFVTFLEEIKGHPIPNEQGIYQQENRYIRLEEIKNKDEVFGVAVDVTAEITKRREIEKERDVDMLTGLYNRRGLDMKLAELFSEPESLGQSAIFMIDADGLKGINDTYGHEKGDIYLKKIGQVIADVGTKSSIASRQGGDEFVLFLYGYDSEEELANVIGDLEYMQSNSFAALDKEINVPLRFSLGYCLVKEETDYQALLKEADRRMYQNKMERKKEMKQK